MRAELERRSGDIDAARAAVDEALDQLEYCSEDVVRIAGVAATGVRVEADAAERARDLGDAEAERVALERAERPDRSAAAAAEAGGPVERGPARGRRGRARPGRGRGGPGALGDGRGDLGVS